MKRTLIIAGVLLALVAVMYTLSRNSSPEDASFDTYEGKFRVDNPDDIARIFITHRDGTNIDLKRGKSGWTVNDTHRARQSSVDVLLEVVSKMDIKYIPTKKAVPNIAKVLAVYGIKVEIFDRKGQNLRTYYVGGSTQDERGTFMIREGSEQPFAMHLPSMDGALRPRFELKEYDWRDRHFLDIQPQEISKVTVNYPRQRHDSFVLNRAGSSYEVTPLYGDTPKARGEFRKAAADRYLHDLTSVACESYENAFPRKDSVRALIPWTEFRINLTDGDSLNFTLYPRGPLVQSEFSHPVHRYFIDCRPGDFMLGQHIVLEKVLRGYDFFFVKG